MTRIEIISDPFQIKFEPEELIFELPEIIIFQFSLRDYSLQKAYT